jgi:hypothetical protein
LYAATTTLTGGENREAPSSERSSTRCSRLACLLSTNPTTMSARYDP